MVYKDKLQIYDGIVIPLVEVFNQTAAKHNVTTMEALLKKEPSIELIQTALGAAMYLSESTLGKDEKTIRPPKSPKQKASKKKR